MSDWAAPRAEGPIRAVVELPGSKSITNRLLVLAALADATSRITAPLRARDTLLMADALRSLGTEIIDDGVDWIVTPGPLHGAEIDTGLAGTVMRFLPPVAALADGMVRFDGDAYARERPMSALLDGLRQAGVQIEDDGRDSMPFTVRAEAQPVGGAVRIDASGSSQFVSGLLLAAARYRDGITVEHAGPTGVPSQPHIEMTLELLRQAGVAVSNPSAGTWRVEPGPIGARDWVVEPDLSNAAPFLAAAMLTGGSVSIPRWPARTTQAGDHLRGLLTAMGAGLERDAQALTVAAGPRLLGLDADLHEVGELAPTIAALAALADTPSRLRGIGHLRGHETDRLAALATELTRLGGDVDEEPDGLTIRPRPLHGGVWRAYADHRMATAGAVIGLAVDGVYVDDIASTSKTFPDFVGLWGACLNPQPVRGSS